VAAVTDGAFVVTDFQVGVMVLFVGDKSDGVHEGHGFVIVFEGEDAGDFLAGGFPPGEGGEVLLGVFRGDGLGHGNLG
jgi:hypothetical protein